eukprot:CAMPEP_0178449726 /NCGR_PEP_ID=MMETSP0689_2-20121128/42724_1 /TAXON_ID=160604 /ORGANISM="Amphidinium massartii, Strain CS-259" /LENGTH=70 /DNA_ID=CAMNT_0020075103 /DNA_START=291 /DNA_END=504 /DNA_ORIENTATION=-
MSFGDKGLNSQLAQIQLLDAASFLHLRELRVQVGQAVVLHSGDMSCSMCQQDRLHNWFNGPKYCDMQTFN